MAPRPMKLGASRTVTPADWNRLLDWLGITDIDGSPWDATFVPQFDQGVTTNIAKTTTRSEWRYDGDHVLYEFEFAFTAGGTAGSALTMTVPVPILAASSSGANGAVTIRDASVPVFQAAVAEWNTSTTVGFVADGGTSFWGVGPATAIAAGDRVRGHLHYRWV